jgi:hypothetical protein
MTRFEILFIARSISRFSEDLQAFANIKIFMEQDDIKKVAILLEEVKENIHFVEKTL